MTQRQFKRKVIRVISSALKKSGDLSIDILENLNIYAKQFAEYLTPKKNEPSGEFAPESSILNSRSNKGFNITGRKRISRELSSMGVLISGTTGSYKSSVSVTSSMLSYAPEPISILVNDPSQELRKKTSGAHLKFGKKIIIIDWCNSKNSASFNPLTFAPEDNFLSYLTKLATKLMNHGGTGNADPFFNQNATRLLVVVFQILRHTPKYNNLFNAYLLLQKLITKEGQLLMNKLVALYSETDPELYESYAGIVGQADKTLSSAISSASVAISEFYLDNELAIITSKTTIDLANIRKFPHSIYIHSSTSNQKYYSKISSTFFQIFFDQFFAKLPEKNDLDTSIICEEFALLEISGFDSICANIRKYRGNIMCVVQNVQQIFKKYPQAAESILSNLRTKLFLSADLSLAEKLERQLGTVQYETKKNGERHRPLLSKDEIMCLSETKGIITVSGKRSTLATVVPYFKTRKYRELAKLPAYEHSNEHSARPEIFDIKSHVEQLEAEFKTDTV